MTDDQIPNKRRAKAAKQPVGWREWVSIPELGIDWIKAKVDTGARTSSLHAVRVKTFEEDGQSFVKFSVHPTQRKTLPNVECTCPVHEFREVRSSSGHVTRRAVILIEVEVVGVRYPIEVTLANRDEMGFRMLLGREALRGRFLVDSQKSYFGGKPPKPGGKRKKKKKKSKKSLKQQPPKDRKQP